MGVFADMPHFSAFKFPPGLWIMRGDIWPFDSKTFRQGKGRAISWEGLDYLWQQRVEINVSWEGR